MDLPLLVAGPILRRVEPTLVSVWLALTQPCAVVLQTWEGRAETGRPNPLAESPATPTLRVGAKLHLDTPLWRAVSQWPECDWPFARVQYALRASALTSSGS